MGYSVRAKFNLAGDLRLMVDKHKQRVWKPLGLGGTVLDLGPRPRFPVRLLDACMIFDLATAVLIDVSEICCHTSDTGYGVRRVERTVKVGRKRVSARRPAHPVPPRQWSTETICRQFSNTGVCQGPNRRKPLS